MIDFLNGLISYIETIWNIVSHTIENLFRVLLILANTVGSYTNIIPLLPTLLSVGVLCYLALYCVKFIIGR